jgi:hypothetical protein
MPWSYRESARAQFLRSGGGGMRADSILGGGADGKGGLCSPPEGTAGEEVQSRQMSRPDHRPMGATQLCIWFRCWRAPDSVPDTYSRLSLLLSGSM